MATAWNKYLIVNEYKWQITFVKEYYLLFMEPEGSLSCLQESASGLYAEPAESTLCPSTLFLLDPF
jgi:hypothetical protein